MTTVLLLSVLIGVIAGLRSMTAPAAVSWAARAGWLNLTSTGLAFLGSALTPWILTALALGELITDKLPTTPSRKAALGFGARIVTGAFSGAAIAAPSGSFVAGAIAGAIGAIIGTFGGHAVRARLAAALGRDRPAALIEDALAVGGAFLILAALS